MCRVSMGTGIYDRNNGLIPGTHTPIDIQNTHGMSVLIHPKRRAISGGSRYEADKNEHTYTKIREKKEATNKYSARVL